jgi:hypothetical protein
LFFMLLEFGAAYLCCCWLNGKKHTTQQAERLREIRDRQDDTAQRTETATQDGGPYSVVQITFLSMVSAQFRSHTSFMVARWLIVQWTSSCRSLRLPAKCLITCI